MSEPVLLLAQRAKEASRVLGVSSLQVRNDALDAMAACLREDAEAIIAANERDVAAAREKGTKDSLIDRLALDAARIEGIAHALEELRALPEVLNVVQQERTMYNGMQLQRVSVPLGVVAMVYEARPNVTADAAGICVKTGNACILRGGSLAFNSCMAITDSLRRALLKVGLPADCVQMVQSSDRSATDELLHARGLVDLLIPRGGAGLINHCVENATVPIIETGTGNCHVYVEASADLSIAKNILINAKCRRYGVCNAAETLLVDASIASAFLPDACAALAEKGVAMHCDDASYAIASEVPGAVVTHATEEDWATEYLAPEIAIRCVSGVEEAVGHINAYGTMHSEAIVTNSDEAAAYFQRNVDASSVYVNAPTSFTDGGEIGLGAEIGISTQKLHARGPFALEALTSYKYLITGTGQVR